MVQKVKGRLILPNAEVGEGADRPLMRPGLGLVAAAGLPAGIIHHGLVLRRERLLLAGVTIAIVAANDYGGTKLATFANKNQLVAGYVLNAVGTLPSPLVGTNLRLSLGSAISAATPLATTAIDKMVAKTPVGAAQAFTCIGHTFDESAPALVFQDAAAANEVWLNATITTTPDATITFTGGYVDSYFFDLEEPVALA